eukprot:UN34500
MGTLKKEQIHNIQNKRNHGVPSILTLRRNIVCAYELPKYMPCSEKGEKLSLKRYIALQHSIDLISCYQKKLLSLDDDGQHFQSVLLLKRQLRCADAAQVRQMLREKSREENISREYFAICQLAFTLLSQ